MVEKLRIAHVTATFRPYQAGTGNVCYYNARELVRLGHRVEVFTVTQPGAPTVEVKGGLKIHRLKPLLQIGNAPLLIRLLSSLRGFDIIHLHCPFISGAEVTSLSASYNKTPLVITYHSDLVRPGTWRDIIFSAATRSSRAILRGAERVLFVSEGHAKTCDMRDHFLAYPERCQVLPNGVDTELFHPRPDRDIVRDKSGIPNKSRVIGFVGALDRAHHYKGLDVLLKAMTSEILGDTRLIVVGDGDQKNLYQQQAVQLGVGSKVYFRGSVEQKSLPMLYQACDVLVVPSRVPESFGLVAAEALACGVPVIATDSPGIRSLVIDGENGLLVKPNDNKDLAAKLSTILSQSIDERRKMGLAGRQRIKSRYSWNIIANQLEGIYAEVLVHKQRVIGMRTKFEGHL